MKHVILVLLSVVVCCLASLDGQVRDQVRAAFERAYPPGSTYAVVVRSDLLTVVVNGARGRSRGDAKITIDVEETGWKQAGSVGREPATGTLTRGEIVKVGEIEYSDKRIEMPLRSIEPHEIVVDPKRPERNRREPVVTVLRVARTGGLTELQWLLNTYLRLFKSQDEARAYAATLGQAQPDRRFTLAVMRRDGVMLPIASYDNGRWSNRWPVPKAERDVPIGLAEVPADWWGLEGAPAKWTLWTPDGQSRPLQVKAPIAFDAHCLMNIGLRTDYKSALPMPPLDQHHYPKDGIAVSDSVTVEPVTVATTADSMWAPTEKMLRPHVNQKEWELARHLPLLDPRFIDATPGVPAIRSVAPSLEVLCHAPGALRDSVAVYFEAIKRYGPVDRHAAQPCEVLTFASGWIHGVTGGPGILDPRSGATLTDCTRWNVEFRKPLGVIRVGGKAVWIMQVSRWGGESYELVEVDGLGTKLIGTVPGGWCKTLGN